MEVQRNKSRLQCVEVVLKPALWTRHGTKPPHYPLTAAAAHDYRGNIESLSCVPVVF